MPSSIIRNGFHVLGLPNSAEMKEILRRSNEIAQFLELDEVSEFDTDIIVAKDFRTAETARDALRRLQNPRQRFEDLFFWLDFKRLELPANAALKADGWIGLARWLARRDGKGRSFTEQRELLVSLTIALKTNASNAMQVFRAWNQLLENSAFWDDLKSTYRFDGQLVASDELIATFRAKVVGSLGDLVLELASGDASSSLVRQFAEVFGAESDSLKEALLSPLLEELKAQDLALARIQTDEKAQITPDVLGKIRNAVKGVESALNALIDGGFYDSSEVKLARDATAIEIRRLVLDCYNHHSEFVVAHGLLNIACSIAGTDALRSQLSSEVQHASEAVESEGANTLHLKVPGTFGGGTVIFQNDTVAYNGVSIRLKDAAGLRFSTFSLHYIIPVLQSYGVALTSVTGQSIDINFGTTLSIGNAAKRDAWAKLAGALDNLAGPHIVERLLKRMFDEDAEVSIGGIVFNRQGYSKKRLFGGVDSVAWDANPYLPKLSAGEVIVWTANAVQLATIPISTLNAVILPELVKACVARVLGDV